MTHYLYRHINLQTDIPFYIGLGSGKNYHRAYETEGRSPEWLDIVSKHDFYVEIVMTGLTLEQACQKEIEFIAMYGRLDLGTGILVNKTNGGTGFKNCLYTESRRNKISNYFKGRTFTEEHKQKLKDAKKSNPYQSKNSLKLLDKNTGVVYESIRKYCEEFNINYSSLKNYLNGNRPMPKKYEHLCIKN